MSSPRTVPLISAVLLIVQGVALLGCQDTNVFDPGAVPLETAAAARIFATLTAQVPSPTPVPTPTSTPTPVPYNIYFGDLHVHTSRIHITKAFRDEFGRGALRLANLYARDVAGYDFIAVTNHARLLDDWMWQVTKGVADEFTEDGVFVSFPAFEWTASHGCGEHCIPERPDYPDWGHRNIYFRNSEVTTPLLRCTDPDYDTPEELFGALPAPDLVTTIPHHTTAPREPFDWSTLNPEYDRLVEIVQRRGDYEADLVENGWAAGHILGVVGGSDTHIAVSGFPQGVTAILAPELTREALFDALLSRHTYATTHGDIILHFFADGEMQGSVLPARSSVRLSGEVVSSSGAISLAELVDNGEAVATWEPDQASSLRFESVQQVGEELHYFYIRVTLDNGHRAWSSPVWVNYATPSPTATATP